MQIAELVTRVAAPIGSAGAAYYFHPDTLAAGKEHGLDGMRFYILGRGGVLGDVEPDVVTSAFGYFHRDVIAKLWSTGREKLAPRDAGRLHMQCAAGIGRASLGGIDGLAAWVSDAEAVVSAADPAGLALFAGVAAEPRPDDIEGRAGQLMVVLRELRGSVHLVAVVASGLSPSVAHAIRRPDMIASFGHDPELAITDADRAALREADELTDRLMAVPFGAIAEDRRAPFVATTDAIAAAIAD